jgi:NDP-sugar pyrophosphorylase family protein
MILAAGRGTRLEGGGSGVPDQPKPLIPLAGEPVLTHNLRLCQRHGIEEVAINLHWRADEVRAHVGDGSPWGVRVTYSHEPALLGTAGGVKRMEAFLRRGTCVVLYGDNYTDCDLTALIQRHRASAAWATVCVFDTRRERHSGIAGSRVLLAEDDAIVGFEETRGAAGNLHSPWTNAGVYALRPEVFGLIPPDCEWDFGREVFPELLRTPGRLRAYQHPGFCFALDTPEAYHLANERLAAMEGWDPPDSHANAAGVRPAKYPRE